MTNNRGYFELIEVVTPGRLHCGLFDLSEDATDNYAGGFAIALKDLDTTVSATDSLSGDWEFVESGDEADVAKESKDPAINALTRRADAAGYLACRLAMSSEAQPHAGLGSGTSRAAGAAIAIAGYSAPADGSFWPKPVIDFNEALLLSGRGGTSGAGVNYARPGCGGVIFDSGHYQPEGERAFLPSSRRQITELPVVNARVSLGPEYTVGLYTDPSTPRISGEKEVALFKKFTPFKREAAWQTISAGYADCLSAFRRENPGALSRGLRKINSCAMKGEERSLQSAAANDFLEACWEESLPAGLSSFGPTTFCLEHSDLPDIAIQSRELAERNGLQALGSYAINNEGASITSHWSGYSALQHMKAEYNRQMHRERILRYGV